MNQPKIMAIAVYSGIAAVVIGLITFTINWNLWELWELWEGPVPGYQILLYPGNQTLIYVWHPLFTEEINLLPKLGLLLLGQFIVVTCIVALIVGIVRKVQALYNKGIKWIQ